MAQVLIETQNQWDKAFFKSFVSLSQRIYRQHPFYLSESVKDFAKRFALGAAFSRHNEWLALLAMDGGRPVGRMIVNVRRDPKERGVFAPLGFFECENRPDVAQALFAHAQEWAVGKGSKQLRTPMSGHFFMSYRIQQAGDSHRDPFYGEPIFPEYYHQLFSQNGFAPLGHWDTYRVSAQAQFAKSLDQREKLKAFSPKALGLVVRAPDMKNWESELKLFHRLICDSYKNMPEFMPISWDEFKSEYWDFKYILDRKFTFFVEFEGEPVGFIVAYRDPLPILLKAQRSPWPWRKLLALWRLRHNQGVLLIPYLGKVFGKENVKGVMATLTKPVLIDYAQERDLFYGCYVNKNSPSFGGSNLLPENVSGSYVLYGKQI
jgi:hypothetical protein